MITIVSGLPRSGTSLMMQMLEAGGLPILTDNQRQPDLHNPRGYYEYEKVKRLHDDNAWLPLAEGMAVKIVSLLLYDLRDDLDCCVLFMRRNLDEVLRSQQSLLKENQAAAGPDDETMKIHFERHLQQVQQWADDQQQIRWLDVEFREVIGTPHVVAGRVAGFLGLSLDVSAMATVVDPQLYRQNLNKDSPF